MRFVLLWLFSTITLAGCLVGPDYQRPEVETPSAWRFEEAETVFRNDLLKNGENPWSLFGLAQCLKARGKTIEAADAEKRFRRAWGRADLELARPVF